jgi:hypothetical protein
MIANKAVPGQGSERDEDALLESYYNREEDLLLAAPIPQNFLVLGLKHK